MPNKRGEPFHPIGNTVKKQAGKTGKKAGKAAGAAKKIGKKILSFLKKLFIDKPAKYLKVAAKNLYLKIKEKGKQKAVDLVPTEKVPEKHQDNQKRQKDGNTLKKLPVSEVIRRANKQQRIRQKVLDNPDLINAQSKDEAEIKLTLADGGTPSTTVNDSEKSADEFFKQLGKEWTARWAYNQYGQQLSDKLIQEFDNNESPETGKNQVAGRNYGRQRKPPGNKLPGNSVTITEDARDWGTSVKDTDSGKTSTSGKQGYTSHRTGKPLKGTGKANVDTDSGDVDLTTTSNQSSSSSSSSSTGTSLGDASGDGLGSSGLTGSNGDSGGSNGGD